MEQAAAVATAESRRRTSVMVTAAIALARVDVALMFLIVFDMVAKPFSWG
jgi:hypothetical protein